MDDREKLIELLNNSFDKQYNKRGLLTAPHTADDLIANGVTIQKWIPVTERLPEQTIRCLVVRFDYVTKTPFIDILWFEKGVWWNRLHGGNYAVTHWMPLPEAPKTT